MFRKCVSGLCFLSLVLVSAGVASATTYTFTDLGVIGGGSSYGYGVNATGQVAGITGSGTGSQPFIDTNGTMSLLSHAGYVKGGYAYAISSTG